MFRLVSLETAFLCHGQTIDNLSKEVTELRRNLDDIQASHRRDVQELNDECDTRLAQVSAKW